MRTSVIAQRRLTHRFDLGWSDLDDWVEIGQLRALAPRLKSTGNGFDQLPTTDQTFVLPRRLTGRPLRQMAMALEEMLSGTSCRHEHDCCGCELRFARVIVKTPRRLTVRISASRNV